MPDEYPTQQSILTAQAKPSSSDPKPTKINEPKVHFTETQSILTQLETKLSTKVLCYYLPPGASINQSHPDIFLEQLRRIGTQDTISLIIVSNGGDSSASLRIATVIREYCKNLQIIIPSRCASAATVLALSADKILMCPTGYLTAIDTSLNHGLNPKGPDNLPVSISVDQIKRILRMLNEEGPAITDSSKEGAYRTLFKYIHPIPIGEIDRISSRTILIATKMMNMHSSSFSDQEKIKWIAEHLYNDYPEHGFPILYQEAKEIGLPVEKADMSITTILRNLINYYDATTLPATTHFSENHYYLNCYTNLIESVGLRTVFHISYNKVLNSITHKWQKEDDTSRWVNITPSEKQGDLPIISHLDIAFYDEKGAVPENQLPAADPT